MIPALYILMITVFLYFISFILVRYGIQKSISHSFYRLKEDNLGVLFTVYIVGFAYPATIIADNIWITSAAFLIMIVGIARDYRDSKVLTFLHLFGAYGGVALCLGGIWLHYNLKFMSIGMVASFIIIYALRKYLPMAETIEEDGTVKKDYSHIFWIEVVVYLSIAYVLHLGL